MTSRAILNGWPLAPGQVAGFTPPVPPTPSAVRIAAAGGLISRSTATGAYTRNETRRQIIGGNGTLEYVKFVYASVYADASGERTDGLSTLTLSAALELTSPVQTVQALFGGATTITLTPGGIVETDPIYPAAFGLSVFPAKLAAFARTSLTFASGSAWPACIPASVESKTSNAASSQLLATGALTTPSGGSSSFYGLVPVAIIGKYVGTPDIAVLVIGDSIFMSSNDNIAGDLTGSGGGMASRGLASVGGRTVPYSKTAIFGQGATMSFTAANSKVRTYLMRYATHLLEDYGTNDDAQSAATVYAAKQAIWSTFRANALAPKFVATTTLLPRASSTTDGYATPAGQTPRSGWKTGGAFRDPLTASVRAGVGQSNGPDAVIETGVTVQDATLTDRWAAGPLTTDGTHPGATAAAQAAAPITTAAAGWSAP